MEATLQPRLPGSADALLEGWCADRVKLRRREAKALTKAIKWLHACVGTGPVDHPHLDETPLGGEGCPALPETAVAEFAGVAQMSVYAARSYLADAWDLEWRLPELHARVRSGEVELWRARHVAAETRMLPIEGAAYVDRRIARIAQKVGPTRLRQLVIMAEILSDPEAAVVRERKAAEGRRVSLRPSFRAPGLVDLFGRLDQADAVDLEAAIQMVAVELGAGEVAEELTSLEVRRSQALGIIARRQLSGSASGFGWGAGVVETRIVHAYVHLRPGDPIAQTGRGEIVPVERVREWCRATGTKVIVRPILDLAAHRSRDGYVPSETMREQAILINRTCVHPYCTRSARSADIDHIVPYDPGGPPSQTECENLAPLCRSHHRLKTHAGWTYTQLELGYFLWSSPAGRSYLRTPSGTITLPRLRSRNAEGAHAA